MANRKLGNLKKLGKLFFFFFFFFKVLLLQVLDFEYKVKIEKSEEKKSETKFRGFRVFDLAMNHESKNFKYEGLLLSVKH